MGHLRYSVTWSPLEVDGLWYSNGSMGLSALTAPGPSTRKVSETSGTGLGYHYLVSFTIYLKMGKKLLRGFHRQPVLSKWYFLRS